MFESAPLALSTLPANSAVYHERFSVPRWNGKVSAASCRCSSTAGRLLRRQLPQWSKEQHLAQAAYHRARAEKLDRIWAQVWPRAFTQAFGVPPQFHDYQITAIGREEVASRHKRVLRHCAYTSTVHLHLARAHERAAGKRSVLR